VKSIALRAGLALLLTGALLSGWNRLREESRHRQVALVVDWTELRDLAARESKTPIDLLKALKDHGATALALGGTTLEDLWIQSRITPMTESDGGYPFDTSRLAVHSPALASLLYWELSHRGVAGLERPQPLARNNKTMVLHRKHGSFLPLRTMEAGFDLDALDAARALGLRIIFRVSQDPWMTKEKLSTYLHDHPLLPHAQAILFNTDTLPGGLDAAGHWISWMKSRSVQNLLFEFKPPRSQKVIAKALPDLTHRAHTIAINELRELRGAQELARWRRAVSERSCRYLLVHASADQSLTDYLEHLAHLRETLEGDHVALGWPAAHTHWKSTPFWYRSLALLFAWIALALGPLFALSLGLKKFRSRPDGWGTTFALICSVTLAAGLVAAACANLPETRLQIMPVRGIKLAFLVGWLGSIFLLFRPDELGTFLRQSVRRLDVLLGGLAALLLAYALLRSGNAAGGWKFNFEQLVRDGLEWILPARPRFKEFAFGHPLMVMGLYLWSRQKERASSWDPRVLVLLGMAGQASMINTFAHLHSPLDLALWRSALGIVFGLLIGWTLSRFFINTGKKVNL